MLFCRPASLGREGKVFLGTSNPTIPVQGSSNVLDRNRPWKVSAWKLFNCQNGGSLASAVLVLGSHRRVDFCPWLRSWS